MAIYLNEDKTGLIDENGDEVTFITMDDVVDLAVDSRKTVQTSLDPTTSKRTEAGFDMARPRYTRRARRVFQIGGTSVSNEQKNFFEQLVNSVKVSSLTFYWLYRANDEVIKVRFDGPPNFAYVGIEGTYLWDITAVLVEV